MDSRAEIVLCSKHVQPVTNAKKLISHELQEKGTFQATDGSRTFRALKTSKEQEAVRPLHANVKLF